eukprot:12984675-Ditylum_brightwellii.AAC.1
MVHIRQHTDRVILHLNRLESRDRGIAGDNDAMHKIFGSQLLYIWSGKLQGLLHHWVFPWTTVNGAILIWHMGSQHDCVPALKLLETDNFLHTHRGNQHFRDLKNFNQTKKSSKTEQTV